MTIKRLLDNTGPITETYVRDEAADVFHISKSQDTAPIFEDNKRLRDNETTSSRRKALKGSMYKVATIPLIIVEELMKKKIWNDPKAMRRWMDDPENRMFRTSNGRLGNYGIGKLY